LTRKSLCRNSLLGRRTELSLHGRCNSGDLGLSAQLSLYGRRRIILYSGSDFSLRWRRAKWPIHGLKVLTYLSCRRQTGIHSTGKGTRGTGTIERATQVTTDVSVVALRARTGDTYTG
jgi:hypothetical protein